MEVMKYKYDTSAKKLLSLDVGTEQSGFCLMTINDLYPIEFGKIDNEELIDLVRAMDYDILVYEAFACYGMAIGQSTITSIQWNGRFIQCAYDRDDRDIDVYPIYRKQEKINLCGSMKAKDANIRQALIDRFAKFDFKNGKGTKNERDWFYGFSKDAWSAYAIGVTYIDLSKEEE